MIEHDWLLQLINDLRAAAEIENRPELLTGLRGVILEYAEEAKLTHDEKIQLLHKLK